MRGRSKAAVPFGIVLIVAVLLYTKWDWFHDMVNSIHDKAQSTTPAEVTERIGDEIGAATSAAGGITIETGKAGATTSPTAKNPPKADATSPGKNTPTVSPVPTGSALKVLDTLTVKGKAPMTGYDRVGKFGQAWTDDNSNTLGHNGCDTRNDILARDLVDETFKPGTRDCVVLTGVLHDPYTGTVINFVRGQGTSTAVQIEHVVALGNVWESGGQQLTQEQRVDIANDPLNLLAVDGPANMSKGKSNAAEWLPANKPFRCDYIARQIAVKDKYGLSVTAPEKEAMQRVLATCPDHGVPTE